MTAKAKLETAAAIAAIIGVIVGLLTWLMPFAPIGPSPLAKASQTETTMPTQRVGLPTPTNSLRARVETRPSPTSAVTSPTPTLPLPTATKQAQPSATAMPPETIQGELSVPCNSKAGARLDVSISGRYMISYAGGSYSPESWTGPSDLHWRSRINIYRNKAVQFGARAFQQGDSSGITYYEPTSPDVIFPGNYVKMTQSQSEDSARAAPAVTFDLNKGDFLTFVCMDDQPYFADNQGAMHFVFVATGR